MTDKTLDSSKEEFQLLLNKSTNLVLEQFEKYETRKAFHDYSQEEVESWFDEALPAEGIDTDTLLKEVKAKILDTATGNLGPHMYGYVVAGGTQISIVAEKLAATINQNVGKWHLAPAMSEIEKRVARWGAEMMGLNDHYSGVLISGGSAANLAGLTVARNIFFEKQQIREKGLFGQRPMIVYASTEVHGCVDKSMELLGLGTEQLRKVKTNTDFTINTVALEEQIKTDIKAGFTPFCIVGTAGTVNTGAIDDLNRLADLAQQYQLWFHVDGAYGGLAAAVPDIKNKYIGMERADSVAMDFHKWLYQPFEAGCLLVKDWQTLRKAYYKQADYLDTALEQKGRLDFNEHHFQLSRNAKALKVWMSFKTYGANQLTAMINKDIVLAKYLADQVDAATDFELMARSDLAIACFRYIGHLTDEEEIVDLNKKIIPALEKDGRVFITSTRLNGRFAIRACLINHRKNKKTTDHLLQVIREVAEGIND